MHFFTSDTINELLSYPALIQALRAGFTKTYTIPPRMHLDYDNPEDLNQNTMLLMPAVACGDLAGVKIVNVSLENKKRDKASIQGIYYLLDAVTGEPLAVFDAKSLTNWRTAAASALAADYLSKKSSETLLMIGAGSLAPYLIQAHAAIREIKNLLIYGRTRSKAESLAQEQSTHFDSVQVLDSLDESIAEADIISAATFSSQPLIHGEYLRPGQHIDLVGAFKPTSRESDDETIRKSSIYIDTEMACKEAGEIAIPIANGILTKSNIQGDLFELCLDQKPGRTSDDQITLFKSVGHALEDLVAAKLIFDQKRH